MQRIAPCLWFDGKAEEAATFYTSVFPNSKIGDVMRYGEAGPGAKGSVLSVTFGDEDAGKAKRVMEAMPKMVKLDIAGLRRAYERG